MLYSMLYQYIISEASKNVVRKNDKKNDENLKEGESTDKPKSILKAIFTSGSFYIIGYLLISLLIQTILLKYYFPHEIQWYGFASAIGFCLVIYFVMWFKDNVDVIYNNPILFSVFLIAYMGYELGNYRKLDAVKVKRGISDRQIEFRYNDKVRVGTSKRLIYIGQTQSTIFLYDKKFGTTNIYKVSEVDSLVVK